MKKSRQFLIVLFLLISHLTLDAQNSISPGYFRSPLDVTHFATGTFAEPRPDHLHSGLDLAVGGKTGASVYAMADGYVSRIKVSPYGYGKVLYLTHPNGTVSVYAHLDEFNVVVNDYVRRKQKEKESFDIELLPDPRLFVFQKGEVIGYAGNSGSSTGPHLHVEIRSEHSERPLNPALFGIYARDVLPPVIKKLMVYPYGAGSTVNNKTGPVLYEFARNSDNRTYTLPDTVKVSGSCYLGAVIRDYVSSSSNDAGIYQLELLVDSVPYFAYRLDSFAFDESRAVNDLIDYAGYVTDRERFLLMKTSPGNVLQIFSACRDRGILRFESPRCCQITIRASDYKGNKAVLRFMMSGTPGATGKEQVPDGARLFAQGAPNHYSGSDIRIELPGEALFNDLYFEYSRKRNGMNDLSALHRVHHRNVPLYKAFSISLSLDSVPVVLMSKVVVARLEAGGKLVSLAGTREAGWIKANSNRFGDFLLAVDTVAPQVKAMNFTEGKNISSMTDLRVRVSDELSGIKTWRMELNGQWVYAEYDPKNYMIRAPVDENWPGGTLEVRVMVGDACGNETVTIFKLTR